MAFAFVLVCCILLVLTSSTGGSLVRSSPVLSWWKAGGGTRFEDCGIITSLLLALQIESKRVVLFLSLQAVVGMEEKGDLDLSLDFADLGSGEGWRLLLFPGAHPQRPSAGLSPACR